MASHSIGVMQPYFFPYIGYFQHIHACDVFVFLDDVDYANLEYVRRNYLLINGKRQAFTLEMENRSQTTKICDLQLSGNDKWRRRILKTIEFNYRKATNFADAHGGSREACCGSRYAECLLN